jgi:hypothetical protein
MYDSQTAIANRHDYDTTYTNEFDNDQTNAVIITPTAGKSLAIKGFYISSEDNTGYVRLIIDGNTVGTVYVNQQQCYVPVVITGNRNSTLRVTSNTGSGMNYFVLVNYREE